MVPLSSSCLRRGDCNACQSPDVFDVTNLHGWLIISLSTVGLTMRIHPYSCDPCATFGTVLLSDFAGGEDGDAEKGRKGGSNLLPVGGLFATPVLLRGDHGGVLKCGKTVTFCVY